MAIRSHRDLEVWKDAMRLVELTYRLADHRRVALGSQAELETQLELAIRLGMVSKPWTSECKQFITRVGKRLHALVDSLGRIES